MAHRSWLGLVALALCATLACSKKKDDKAQPSTGLDKRCEQLAKICGDTDKHIEKLLDECKQAAAKLTDKACEAKVVAAYDCYENELCNKTDKVWALDDLRVLTERHKKCIAERDAARACSAK